MREVTGDDEVTGRHPDDSPTATAPLDQPTELRHCVTLKRRYVLVSSIGEGGMGTVHRALDLTLQKGKYREPYVALKILQPELIRDFPDAPLMLQREAVRTRQLGHHNIVRVFDCDEDAGTWFITMELLQGAPLSAKLKDRVQGLTVKHMLFYLEQICAGLAYAHSQRLVHSDLKPGNIFVTSDDVVKILDFGIASQFRKRGQAGVETVLDTRQLGVLSPLYASPQQFRREAADPRDDVYSLGCVVYQMLTNRLPFGDMPSVQAMQAGICVPQVKSLNDRQNQALRRAMAFEREKRTATIEEFFDAMNDGRSVASVSWQWLATGLLVLSAAIGIGAYLQRKGPASETPSVSQPQPPAVSAAASADSAKISTPITAPVEKLPDRPSKQQEIAAATPATLCDVTSVGQAFEAVLQQGLDAQARFAIAPNDAARASALTEIREVGRCLQSLQQRKVRTPQGDAWLGDVADAMEAAAR